LEMKTVTLQQAISKSCSDYGEEQLLKLSNDRRVIPLIDVLDMDIPFDDKIYFITRFLSEYENRMIAAACAELVLHIYEGEYPKNMRPRNAIKAARLFAMGEIDRSELSAARAADRAADLAVDRAADRAAAWSASRAAYLAASRSAAWSASWAAYLAASRAAYLAVDRAADRAAARAADRAAARDAARDEILNIFRIYLEAEDEM
jgi:hypothetical protein